MQKIFGSIMLVFSLICCPLTGTAADDASSILQQAWEAYNIGQYKKAVSLLQPLAMDGNPRAQVILGRCYENGTGVPQDMAVAAKWYQLAAEKNDSEGQVLLAYQYAYGTGLAKNEKKAADLMQRAATAGNPEAQYNLALAYGQGRYTFPKDTAQSFLWAKAAADQGFAQAQQYVGVCYEFGIGVQKSEADARLWYGKAAAQGVDKNSNVFVRIREYTMP